MVAGCRWLRGVQRLIPAMGDLWLQGCGGCEEYRDFYLHWETYDYRVAVVVGAHRLIPTLGDLWLQGCGGCRSTYTYTYTGRPMVAGLWWL